MAETNVIQNTDSATARVKDTLHLSFAGLSVEGSVVSGRIRKLVFLVLPSSWWFPSCKLVMQASHAALNHLSKYHQIIFQCS
jgi:hypothetical protein